MAAVCRVLLRELREPPAGSLETSHDGCAETRLGLAAGRAGEEAHSRSIP